ncbi:MAG TPA: type II secretion system protein GspG [Pyrinomonadaceae bacterium]|nr:type II secretion system protein GspG [Pyrinomonadaceae bacterium]
MLRTYRRTLVFVCAALLLVAPLAGVVCAKTKKPIKDDDARRAIATMPGFALNRGAVKVKDAVAVDAASVLVTAEVETAVRFQQMEVEEEGVKRWRAVEFRSGDRSWEEFEWLAEAVGAERIERARTLLEEAATEFAANELKRRRLQEEEQRAREARERERPSPETLTKAERKRLEREAKREAELRKKEEERLKSEREVRRGALRLTDFSPLASSAVAVCFIEAQFRLARGSDGKWRVVEFRIGDESSGDPARLLAAVDARKVARAREELETVRAALEAFRRERGFYPVVTDSTALVDHLSPRYLSHIIRIDPWHRPYRYEGERERFVLRSDGADGVAGTGDDVTLNR